VGGIGDRNRREHVSVERLIKAETLESRSSRRLGVVESGSRSEQPVGTSRAREEQAAMQNARAR